MLGHLGITDGVQGSQKTGRPLTVTNEGFAEILHCPERHVCQFMKCLMAYGPLDLSVINFKREPLTL